MCLLRPSFPVTGSGESGTEEVGFGIDCHAGRSGLTVRDDTGIEDKKEVKAWSLSGQATTTVNHEGIVCPF